MADFRTLLPKRASLEPSINWVMEQKRDRVVWLTCAGAVPLIILAVFHHTLTTIMVLQAYLLTCIEFGLVFFVKERENTRRPWLWKSLAVCIVVHISVLLAVFSLDKSNPQLTDNGFVLAGVLFLPAMIELYIFLLIVEFCKPSEGNR